MKKINASYVIALASVFFCSISYAETECPALPKHHCVTDCMDLNTTDRSFCYRDKQAEAEKALNAKYSQLLPLAQKYSPQLVESLRRAERSWVNFRALNCHFYGDKDRELRGGEEADCILRMTRERINELMDAIDEITPIVESSMASPKP